MNITFLIGNGFDINLGLPTKYSDFLAYHNAKGYTDMISLSMRDDLKRWSDVESELGAFAAGLTIEEVDAFLDAKENVEQSLIEYLTLIAEEFSIAMSDEGAMEFRNKLVGFSNEFRTEDREQLEKYISETFDSISYSIITFNYTSYIDSIMKKAKELGPFSTHIVNRHTINDSLRGPFHIHGILGPDMIFGVNDRSQMACSDEVAKRISEYMIKSNLNSAVGERKVDKAKQMIDSSEYICIFGMSMGQTDLMWWKYIFEWMKKSSKHHLVLYKRYTTPTIIGASAAARRRNSARREFLNLVGAKDDGAKVENQIIVIPNTSVFTYEKIKVADKNG